MSDVPVVTLSTDSLLVQRSQKALLGRLAVSCPSEESKKSYLSALQHFSSFMRATGKFIGEATRFEVQAYLEYLNQQKYAPATRAKRLIIIKGLMRCLAIEGIYPMGEADKIYSIKAPKVSHDGCTPGLSSQEARALLDQPSTDSLLGIRDRAILAVLLYTGARRSAVCSIKLGHLFNEKGVQHVLLHEKGERKFRVPLHSEVAERINLWISAAKIDTRKADDYLFQPFFRNTRLLVNKEMHDSMIWRIVKKYASAAGMQVNRLDERGICAHSTRVTAITNSFEGGATIEEIQQLVGHKDPRNTMRYRKATSKDISNAVASIKY